MISLVQSDDRQWQSRGTDVLCSEGFVNKVGSEPGIKE